MKSEWKRKAGLAFVAAAALAVWGCNKAGAPGGAQPAGKEFALQQGGDLTIALASESGELKQGSNQFTIAFRNASGRAVDAGTVSVSSSMAMPGMAPMVAPVEMTPSGTGIYVAKGDFSMSGAWRFDVRWDGPAGQGATAFNVNVR
jgi:hypothetical protein